jgi:23S rRNA (cytidine2498-2'-O)-methyltransferase
MRYVNKLIFTTDASSNQMALNEMNSFLENNSFAGWLDGGIGVFDLQTAFAEVAKLFIKNQAMFVRHICPADFELEIKKDVNDIKQILDHKRDLMDKLDKKKTFSIQTRLVSDTSFPYKASDINKKLADALNQEGFSLDVKSPEQIISIFITENLAYIGISLAKYNLSNWSGGEYKFKKDENLISRAEFKLLEAIDVFNLDFRMYKTGLDLGAAPGGWTKVLLVHGLKVVAVDPAELNPTIVKNPNVQHFKGLAQDYLKKSNKFDVIVNDMRMDVKESIALMGVASEYLNSGGIAIMTLKLPTKKVQAIANDSIAKLQDWYNIHDARQLFHNRSEVTVVLKKK